MRNYQDLMNVVESIIDGIGMIEGVKIHCDSQCDLERLGESEEFILTEGNLNVSIYIGDRFK